MDTYDFNDILTSISKIKRSRKKIYSNYLPLSSSEEKKIEQAFLTDNSVVFTLKDGCVTRIFFYSSDESELKELLSQITPGAILEYYSKSMDDNLESLLKDSFTLKTVLRKATSVKMSKEFLESPIWRAYRSMINEDIGDYAVPGDEEDIFEILSQNFDPTIDHIPDKEDILNNYIRKKCALIYRENGKVEGLSLFQINGKKMFNQYVYSNKNLEVVVSLGDKIDKIQQELGIQYSYGYVDLSNKQSSRWHKIINVNFDDLFNHIYQKK